MEIFQLASSKVVKMIEVLGACCKNAETSHPHSVSPHAANASTDRINCAPQFC